MERLSKARIEPLALSEMDEEIRQRLQRGDSETKVHNINGTIARHPKLFKRWIVFANHILFKQTLPSRDREILILRVGWLCQAPYEWNAHVRIGKQVGLTDQEIERIKEGADADGWTALETLLLRAVDELHTDYMISDATWTDLIGYYSEKQMLDLIFTVGQYHLVSMALNSLGVQIE